MYRHIISIVALVLAHVLACKAQSIPVGEYCHKASGNLVSKLASHESGSTSVHLAGDTATVNIGDSSYTVDRSSGKITLEAMKEVDNLKFPYILHKWSLEYQQKTDVVRLLVPHRGTYLNFTRRGCSSQNRQLQVEEDMRFPPAGLFREFCTAEGDISGDVSGAYDLVNGASGMSYSARFVSGRVAVSLHDIKFRLLKVPNKEVYWVNSRQVDDIATDLNYPYLDYGMRIHYTDEGVLKATRGISGEHPIVLSHDKC
ncbi:hypothetical protein FOL47_009918 [Perkinsus chesapeaki]|uniref:Uncharacterized protein n=1 Tax=Perkinsus chesapeaki TaxID=330153 RepID=A0A7J6L5S3_PERCH|nr:hypothetical protein FOL47_009918 [Perkinsus chesapeaki]